MKKLLARTNKGFYIVFTLVGLFFIAALVLAADAVPAE